MNLLSSILFICVCVRFTLAEIEDCDIHDTVNITNSELLPNGSYFFEGIVIPPGLVGTYEHEIYGGQRIPVDPHLRGCVCRFKICVKFCCKFGLTGIPHSWDCLDFDDSELAIHVNITLNNGSKISVPVSEKFAVQEDIPCVVSYNLVPHEDPDHEWELFENGTLALPKLNQYVSKNEYCLNPQKNTNGVANVMTPMHCNKIQISPIFYFNNYCMAISVPFLLLTTVIYLSVPEFRGLHGKCLICNFISLAMGYTSLALINFIADMSDVPCRIFGYLAYFSFLSAFGWLSVISFDLRHNLINNIPENRRLNPAKTFLLYCASAWGFPAILTSIVVFIQYFTDIPNEWKPQIGSAEYCWLPTIGWTPMIYFYGLMLIAMLMNLVTYIYTAYKIRELRILINSIGRSEASSKHLALFLRLFILMGLTWLFEIGSFMVGPDKSWSFVFWPADFLNSLQGIIIFIFAVCSKKSLRELKKRYRPNAKRDSHTQTTTLSSNTINMNAIQKNSNLK